MCHNVDVKLSFWVTLCNRLLAVVSQMLSAVRPLPDPLIKHATLEPWRMNNPS